MMLFRGTKQYPATPRLHEHVLAEVNAARKDQSAKRNPGAPRKRGVKLLRKLLLALLIACFLFRQASLSSFTKNPTIGFQATDSKSGGYGLAVVTDPRIWVAEEDSGLEDFRNAVSIATHGKATLLELPTADTTLEYKLSMRRLIRFYKPTVSVNRKNLKDARVNQLHKRQQQILTRQKVGLKNEVPKLKTFQDAKSIFLKDILPNRSSTALRSAESIDQLHKKTTLLSNPTFSSKLSSCHVQANSDYIRTNVNAQREMKLPLLASLVQSPNRREMLHQQSPRMYWTATFSLCDITWRNPGRDRKRIPEVSDSKNWKCNAQQGMVIEQGCPSGCTVTIQCPESPGDSISKISYSNYTYHVRELVQCELNRSLIPAKSKEGRDEEQLLSLPRVQEPKIVASVIIYHVSVTALLEWMEYHRLMGVDQFWVYVMEDGGEFSMPDLPYVTFIPWDLNPNMSRTWDKFLFQTAAQVDTLHRARRLGSVEWVMYLDLDEFLVIRRRVSDEEGVVSIPKYLQSEVDDSVDAVQMETVSFGSKAPLNHPLEFQLNYTWRSVGSFGSQRCKSIVRPSRIDYINIHWATAPEEISILKASPDRVWIHHYKKPHNGVFLKELSNKDVTEDVEIRDLFAAIVVDRVRQTLKFWDTAKKAI